MNLSDWSSFCRADLHISGPDNFLLLLLVVAREVGGCSVYYRVFSNISGFYPLGASSKPLPSYDNQKCLQTLLNVPWWKKKKSSQIDNHHPRGIIIISSSIAFKFFWRF